MDETKVQIGEDVLLDIGIHSDWYISSICYDGESVDVALRRKADRNKEWWLADTPQMETQNSNKNSNVILVSDGVSEMIRCAMCNKSYKGCDGACSYDEKLYKRIMDAIDESRVDTPQTEAVVKPYKPTNREILDAIENSDCPWK